MPFLHLMRIKLYGVFQTKGLKGFIFIMWKLSLLWVFKRKPVCFSPDTINNFFLSTFNGFGWKRLMKNSVWQAYTHFNGNVTCGETRSSLHTFLPWPWFNMIMKTQICTIFKKNNFWLVRFLKKEAGAIFYQKFFMTKTWWVWSGTFPFLFGPLAFW